MQYVAIRSEGGLIPYDILDQISKEEIAGQKGADATIGLETRSRPEPSVTCATSSSLSSKVGWTLGRAVP